LRLITKNKKIASRIIEGKAFVVTPFDSTLHMFNPLATRIWQLLDKENRIEEIVKKICQEYEVDEKIARRDVNELINKLEKKKIVEVTDPERRNEISKHG